MGAEVQQANKIVTQMPRDVKQIILTIKMRSCTSAHLRLQGSVATDLREGGSFNCSFFWEFLSGFNCDLIFRKNFL